MAGTPPKIRILFVVCDDYKFGPIEPLKLAIEEVGQIHLTIDVLHKQKEAMKNLNRLSYSHVLFTVTPENHQNSVHAVKSMRNTRFSQPIIAVMEDASKFTDSLGFEDVLIQPLTLHRCRGFVVKWIIPFLLQNNSAEEFSSSISLPRAQCDNLSISSSSALSQFQYPSNNSHSTPTMESDTLAPRCECCGRAKRAIHIRKYDMNSRKRQKVGDRDTSATISRSCVPLAFNRTVQFSKFPVAKRPQLHCSYVLLYNDDSVGESDLNVHAYDRRFSEYFGYERGMLKKLDDLLAGKVKNEERVKNIVTILNSGETSRYSSFMNLLKADDQVLSAFVSIKPFKRVSGRNLRQIKPHEATKNATRFFIASITPTSERGWALNYKLSRQRKKNDLGVLYTSDEQFSGLFTQTTNSPRDPEFDDRATDVTSKYKELLDGATEKPNNEGTEGACEDSTHTSGCDIAKVDSWGEFMNEVLKTDNVNGVVERYLQSGLIDDEDDTQTSQILQVPETQPDISYNDDTINHSSDLMHVEVPTIISTDFDVVNHTGDMKMACFSEEADITNVDFRNLFNDDATCNNSPDDLSASTELKFTGTSVWV